MKRISENVFFCFCQSKLSRQFSSTRLRMNEEWWHHHETNDNTKTVTPDSSLITHEITTEKRYSPWQLQDISGCVMLAATPFYVETSHEQLRPMELLHGIHHLGVAGSVTSVQTIISWITMDVSLRFSLLHGSLSCGIHGIGKAGCYVERMVWNSSGVQKSIMHAPLPTDSIGVRLRYLSFIASARFDFHFWPVDILWIHF